jgi:hypothetical protein
MPADATGGDPGGRGDLDHLGEVALIPPTGGPLRAGLVGVRYAEERGQVLEARLRLRLDAAGYRRVDADALFRLLPDLRSPEAAQFSGARGAEIEARLDPQLLPDLLAQAPAAAGAERLLLDLGRPHGGGGEGGKDGEGGEGAGHSPLLETERWFALKVLEDVPLPSALAARLSEGARVATGFTTVWLDAPAGGVGSSHLPRQLEQYGEAVPQMPETPDAPEATMKQVVEQVLSDHDIEYDAQPERSAYRFPVEGEDDSWVCLVVADEDRDTCLVYSVFQDDTPEERRPAMAEFITRANYGLPLGNFEMDYDDGEVRFKTSIDVEGDRLSPALFRQLLRANWSIMEQYYPGVASVASGEATPQEAVDRVEQ